jgi:hypothetical protein
MNRFAKLALTAATAIGLATAPITASAEPGGQDIARVLAGLAVLGIIANASRDRDRNVSRGATDYSRIESDWNRNREWDDGRHRDWDDGGRVIRGDIDRYGRQKGDHRGYKRAALPDQCLLTVDTGRRNFLAYGERCLERSYKHASKLPRSCEWQVRTNRGVRTVYGARCLANDGWRVASR